MVPSHRMKPATSTEPYALCSALSIRHISPGCLAHTNET
jgi:hypothetical protein